MEYFDKCLITELKSAVCHSGGFTSQQQEVRGTALHHRHQSSMLHQTLDVMLASIHSELLATETWWQFETATNWPF